MNLTFVNGTTRQRAWCQRVIDESSYPFSAWSSAVSVEFVDDPSRYGAHTAFAYTDTFADGSAHVRIRSDLGDTNTNFNLFSDVFHHELGHAVLGAIVASGRSVIDSIIPLFYRNGRQGVAADWNSAEVWADRINEATTETFKDTFAGAREWNNRTNFQLPERYFAQWVNLYAPAASGGGSQGQVYMQNAPLGAGVLGTDPTTGHTTVTYVTPVGSIADPGYDLITTIASFGVDTAGLAGINHVECTAIEAGRGSYTASARPLFSGATSMADFDNDFLDFGEPVPITRAELPLGYQIRIVVYLTGTQQVIPAITNFRAYGEYNIPAGGTLTANWPYVAPGESQLALAVAKAERDLYGHGQRSMTLAPAQRLEFDAQAFRAQLRARLTAVARIERSR